MTLIAGTGSSNKIFTGFKKDFIVMRKDTFEYTGQIDYTDENGTKCTYDFTDCIGAMAIKKKKTDTTAVRIVSVAFDGVEYTLYVEADDMDMDAGKYCYDLQVYDANHKMVTKLYGDFIVLQDITDMAYPKDEEIYFNLSSIIGYQKMLSLKNTFLLLSDTDYMVGTGNKTTFNIGNIITYTYQPKQIQTLVISNEIAYNLMSYYLKVSNLMYSEISYMSTVFLDVSGLLYNEIDYTIFYAI